MQFAGAVLHGAHPREIDVQAPLELKGLAAWVVWLAGFLVTCAVVTATITSSFDGDTQKWIRLVTRVSAWLLVPLFFFYILHWVLVGLERKRRQGLPGGAQSEHRGTVEILAAWYGIGETWVRVDSEVKSLLVPGRGLAFTSSHDILGIKDPVLGSEKRLDIDWALDGVQQQKMFFVEGTAVLLPPGDHVEYASYTCSLNGNKLIGPTGGGHAAATPS